MQRKEREIKDQDVILDILQKNIICRVAYADNNKPYITPLNYGFKDNYIYVHSAKKGKKIDIISKNNQICFEISDSIKIKESDVACKCGTAFRSVVGYGEMIEVTQRDQKVTGLQIIMKQHTGRDDWDFIEKVVTMTKIFKIKINSITGKQIS